MFYNLEASLLSLKEVAQKYALEKIKIQDI